MVKVSAVEPVHLDEPTVQEMIAQENQDIANPSRSNGLALHEYFDKDVLDELKSQATEIETLSPTLWQRFLNWFKGTGEDSNTVSELKKTNKIAHSDEIKPEVISSVPVLDPPENIPEDLKTAKLTDLSRKDDLRKKVGSQEIEEALSLMSKHTVENIMFIIFKAQLQLEKENAKTVEGTFNKYLDFQKLQQKVLVEIKDALADDENISRRFGTAQNIAVFLAGVATLAVTFGLLSPVLSFLSTAATAGLTALTLGAKSYFQHRMNNHKAQRENYSHKTQYFENLKNDASNRLWTTAEYNAQCAKSAIDYLRQQDKLRKIILKK